MTDTKEKPKAFVTPSPEKPATKKEFLHRIEIELPKEKGQNIRATHVYADNFRVNWLTPTSDNIMTTWKIVDSKFMNIQVVDGKLVTVDKTIRV